MLSITAFSPHTQYFYTVSDVSVKAFSGEGEQAVSFIRQHSKVVCVLGLSIKVDMTASLWLLQGCCCHFKVMLQCCKDLILIRPAAGGVRGALIKCLKWPPLQQFAPFKKCREGEKRGLCCKPN